MTKAEVITGLYTGQTIEKTARKLYPQLGNEDMYQDLVQEVYLMVCMMDEDKLLRLHRGGELEKYVAKMTINQISNPSSMFHTKYYKLEIHKTRQSLNEDRL